MAETEHFEELLSTDASIQYSCAWKMERTAIYFVVS